MSASAENLIAYCRENNRVCPLPKLWAQLYEMLPNTRRKGAGWEPASPLILGGWHFSDDEEKKHRLAEHIEWAEKHGSLEEVDRFLRGLRKEDWFYAGE